MSGFIDVASSIVVATVTQKLFTGDNGFLRMTLEVALTHLCDQFRSFISVTGSEQRLCFHHQHVGITQQGEVVAQSVSAVLGIFKFAPAQSLVLFRAVDAVDLIDIGQRFANHATHCAFEHFAVGRILGTSDEVVSQSLIILVKGVDILRHDANAAPRSSLEVIGSLVFGL